MIVIILVHNEFDITGKCVDSILQATDKHEGVKVVWVNNGSTDTIVGEYLKRVCEDNKDWFVYRENKSNKLFTTACIEVINDYPGEDIYFLNNDTEVQNGWLSGRELLKDYAAVGATQIHPRDHDFIIFAGGMPDFKGHHVMWKWKFDKTYEKEFDIQWLTFGACMVQREAYDKIGGMDSRLVFYCSDSDLSLRFKDAGYKICVSPKMKVAHWGGWTTRVKMNDESFKRNFEGTEDQILFAEKHALYIEGVINMERYEHSKRKEWFSRYFNNGAAEARNKIVCKRHVNYLNSLYPVKGKRVLEIGCAWGNVVEGLNIMGADAVGLDLVLPSPKDRLHEIDLETDIDKLDGLGKFDLIISQAVLEHITNAEQVVSKMHSLLNEGGCVYHEIDTNKGTDSSHINIHDSAYWQELFIRTGFKITKEELWKSGMYSIMAVKI